MLPPLMSNVLEQHLGHITDVFAEPVLFACPQESSLLSNEGKQPFGLAMAKSVTSSSSSLQIIGQPVTRIDARVKVTGEAQFSADRMPADGVLFGKTLRSPYPHAEIIRIDITKTVGLPGLRAVVTFHDAPENPFEDGEDSPTEEPLAPVYLLNRIVRHVGDEVAAVAADSEEIAEEALRLIEIEYRTLPFVLDAESALAPGAPSIRGGS